MYRILLFICVGLYIADLECMDSTRKAPEELMIAIGGSASDNLATPLLPLPDAVLLTRAEPTSESPSIQHHHALTILTSASVPDAEHKEPEVRVLPQQQAEPEEWFCGPCCVCSQRTFLTATFIVVWGIFVASIYLVKRFEHS